MVPIVQEQGFDGVVQVVFGELALALGLLDNRGWGGGGLGLRLGAGCSLFLCLGLCNGGFGRLQRFRGGYWVMGSHWGFSRCGLDAFHRLCHVCYAVSKVMQVIHYLA